MAKRNTERQLADDALAIERAKAANGKRTEYRIVAPGLRGFTLRAEPNGHATYWLRYSVNKHERRLKLGVRGLMTFKEAKIAARENLIAIEKGGDPVAVKIERREAPTFAELWERRKTDNMGELAEGTIANYEGVLRKYALRAIGAKKVGDVTADDVRAILDTIRDTKRQLKRNPHNATLVSIASTFAWGRGKGLTTNDPTEHLRPLPGPQPRKRSLDAEELGRLWNAIGSTPGIKPKMRIALRVLLLTGQRNTNIAAARVSWIKPNLDVANPVLVVPAAKMKVKTDDHMLPLVPAVVALIREAVALDPGSEFIFPSPKKGKRGHYTRHSVANAMREVIAVAGIDDVHAHDFRHLMKTWMAEQQISKEVRDKIAHHSVSKVEATYNSAKLIGPVRQALQGWADHVQRVSRSVGAGNDRVSAVPMRRA